MKRYFLGRLIQTVVSLFIVASITFILVRLTGNPIDVLTSPRMNQEAIKNVEKKFGLDKPLIIQYGIYMSKVLRGDLGRSFQYEKAVHILILERLPATLELTFAATVFALMVAIPLGIYSAVYRGGIFDTFSRALAYVGQAAPLFWTGLMLIWIFCLIFNVLPSGGRGGIKHLILPSVTLGWVAMAGVLRLTRSSMMEVLDQEYVTLARAKGLPERKVVWKHALKNATLSILTFIAVLFVVLLSGAVVTETVFAWPGLGRLMMNAVLMRDFPLVQGIILVLSAMYILINFLVDIMYGWLNPKIRSQ